MLVSLNNDTCNAIIILTGFFLAIIGFSKEIAKNNRGLRFLENLWVKIPFTLLCFILASYATVQKENNAKAETDHASAVLKIQHTADVTARKQDSAQLSLANHKVDSLRHAVDADQIQIIGAQNLLEHKNSMIIAIQHETIAEMRGGDFPILMSGLSEGDDGNSGDSKWINISLVNTSRKIPTFDVRIRSIAAFKKRVDTSLTVLLPGESCPVYSMNYTDLRDADYHWLFEVRWKLRMYECEINFSKQGDKITLEDNFYYYENKRHTLYELRATLKKSTLNNGF